MSPNIYQVDKNHYQLRALENTTDILKFIITKARKQREFSEPFDPERISSFQKDEFTYYLYLVNTNELESDWSKFLPAELRATNNFIQQKISLILLVETEFELYAVVGGSAFRMIIPFIDHSFGLNAYDRIIEPDKDELTSIRTRGITGQRIGMNEQFRNEYRIANFTRFGKLPKEIHVKLCRETTDTYFSQLKAKANDRLQITVGAGFKVGKQVDFEDMHYLIQDMALIATQSPKDYLSSYKEINDDKDIYEFKKLLIHKLYNNLAYLYHNSRLPSDRFDFDFCHPKHIDKFYEAETYELKVKTEDGGYRVFATLDDREAIFKCVMDHVVATVGENSEYNFGAYLWTIIVASLKGDKTTASSGFLFYFSAEFTYNNEPVFLIDTKWFYLKEQFITDMIVNSQHIFRTYRAKPGILKFPWDKDVLAKEGLYNMLYDAEANYIVCDTIIVDGVELCDILCYDSKNLYLIHVKAGFNSKIRELSNQVLISARRLKEAVNGKNSTYIERFYERLVSSGRNYDNLNLEKFKKLFKKQISYVMAISSTLNEDLVIEDHMHKYDSNIARFSMIQCSNEMYASYYPLLTYQIPRVSKDTAADE